MSELRLFMSIDYEIESASQDVEEIVDEVMRTEARRFAAAVSDELERRGLDDIQVRVRGD